MFYWVSQGPPHHKCLQCLKKRQHSDKNTIRRSLEIFQKSSNQKPESKKESIEAIAAVSKSSNRRRPFREGPLLYQGRPNGGQKFRSNYNGKHILFQKKGIPSQQQPNFNSSYDKHGGINSCSSNSKKIIF